jgi:hypothetical protein
MHGNLVDETCDKMEDAAHVSNTVENFEVHADHCEGAEETSNCCERKIPVPGTMDKSFLF